MNNGIGFDYGRGDGLAIVLAAVLIVAWPVVLIGLVVGFGWYVVRPTIKAAVKRWPVTIVGLVLVALALVLGPVAAAGATVGFAIGLAMDLTVLRLVRPELFARFVSGPWRRRRRRFRIAKTWADLTVAHGLGTNAVVPRRLGSNVRRITYVPQVKRIRPGACIDRVIFRPLAGQSADVWARQVDALALAYGAVECRIAQHTGTLLRLDIVHRDPLNGIVPALPVPEAVDLDAVPVGLLEDGTVCTLRLDGNHLLVAGSTGAGKGSVLWSIVRALGPAIRDGYVQVWALDPKGGQELYPGRPLFHAYADESPEAMVALLEDLVKVMEARAQRYRHRLLRKHRTTLDEPFIVLVVDELADLTNLPSKPLRERAVAAMSTLLRKGRSLGVCVEVFVQDPAKDVVPFRQLIPTRIGLRLAEKAQVPMVLGEGAREAGAYCDRIPHPGAEGIGYLVVADRKEPARARFGWVTDPHLEAMRMSYPAPINVDGGQADEVDGGSQLGEAA
jgi:S-DNA-T family DNA segregation ATPase FtsK/SpoIIIE